jgi:DNA polymerase III subunit beta
VTALFPSGEPLARARFQTLEPVLLAASTDETRKAMCGVFFELCKNIVVATDGHVLHALEVQSDDRGDFLVPRKAIEFVEIVRKATKTPEVSVAFHENHAVFRIAMFQISARLESAKFPTWEEVVPKKSKHELRVSKTDLLEALDRVAAAIGDRARGVVLHRVGDRLEIYGENPRAGELKTDIAASGWTDKAVIEVNLGYLYNAVRFSPSDRLRIGVTDDASPVKIHEGPYCALVMPIGPRKEAKS